MSSKYEVVIGLEIHAELSTKTKMFCGCENRFGAEPNTLTCPICCAMPGTLPVMNADVPEYAIRMGHALNCKINPISQCDRKSYFYPDIPKNFQTSQLEVPICGPGYLDVVMDDKGTTRRIGITRIHIEEDAGKALHEGSVGDSLMDFNRGGVPLIEIVTEPDMRSAAEVKALLESIKSILSYLDICDCKMQEGSIRCDVNVSVREVGAPKYGVRVEMKNVNSFSAAERAVIYEAGRHIAVLEDGGTLEQETRRWDDVKGASYSMRSKEDATDYRYFPEPDLLTIVIDEEKIEALKGTLPELPNAKRARFVSDFDLPFTDATLLTDSLERALFFEEAVACGKCQPKSIANWLLGDIARVLNDKNCTLADTSLTPKMLFDMVVMQEAGEISSAAAKTVLDEIIFTGKQPADVVAERGLKQISDTAFLDGIVAEVLAANPKAVEDYKKGKTNVTGFLVGQCMKLSKGQGNPAILGELIVKHIEEL